MPEGDGAPVIRLHRVRVATRRGAIELPLDSRDALLDRLASIDGAGAIVDAFVAAGVTRTVELRRQDAELLNHAITSWAHFVGTPRLPAGLWALRNAISEDLHGAPSD